MADQSTVDVPGGVSAFGGFYGPAPASPVQAELLKAASTSPLCLPVVGRLVGSCLYSCEWGFNWHEAASPLQT